jgi:hypothetical protein
LAITIPTDDRDDTLAVFTPGLLAPTFSVLAADSINVRKSIANRYNPQTHMAAFPGPFPGLIRAVGNPCYFALWN